MHRITDSPWAAVCVAVLLALGLYVGAYRLTVERWFVTFSQSVVSGPAIDISVGGPRYHQDDAFDAVLQRIFAPVHAIDHRIRGNYWTITTTHQAAP